MNEGQNRNIKCPGSRDINRPKPLYLKCPNCGNEVEIWTDEFKATCENCKEDVFREEAPSCIEWCKEAKECIGEEKYNQLIKQKK